MSDFTGQIEKMPCEHSYALINELEAFKTAIFDAAEVRTMKALVRDHQSLTDRLAEAERQLKIYKKAVDHYAQEINWDGFNFVVYMKYPYEVAQAAIREAETPSE